MGEGIGVLAEDQAAAWSGLRASLRPPPQTLWGFVREDSVEIQSWTGTRRPSESSEIMARVACGRIAFTLAENVDELIPDLRP